jgi:ATP-binding cassette subfamily B protein
MLNKITLSKLWLVLTRRQRKYLINLVFFSIAAGLLDLLSIGLIIPYIGIITSGGVKNQKFIEVFSGLAPILLSFPLFYLVTAIFIIVLIASVSARVAMLRYSTKITFIIGAELAHELIKKWIFIDYQSKKETDSAEVVTLLNNKVNDLILNVLFPSITLVSSSIFSLIISLYLFYLFPLLAILIIPIVLGAYLMVAYFQKNKVNKLSKVAADSQHKATKILMDILLANKEIIVYKKQDSFTSRYNEESKNFRDAQGAIMFAAYSPRYIIEGIGIMLLIVISNILVLQTSPEALFAAMGTIALGTQKLLPNLQQAYSALTLIKGSRKTIEDFLKSWNQGQLLHAKISSAPLDYQRNFSLTIRSFSFKNNEILRNIFLAVPKDTSVALIAPSGSGKSTVVDLLLGFLFSEGAEIKVDNVIITPIHLEGWRSLISYVPQNMYVYDTDVISNITYYEENVVDSDRLDLALELTGIRDNFQFCLSTHLVGDNGAKLSGGQRQRIALARAIYSKKPIIILDEATNALDKMAERDILSKIATLSGKTLFVITHRLELLNLFTKIAYINTQKTIISGSLDELLANDSEFKYFVTATKNID